MKTILVIASLSFAHMTNAKTCFTIDKNQLPSTSIGQLYEKVFNTIPENICLTVSEFDIVQRKITYEVVSSKAPAQKIILNFIPAQSKIKTSYNLYIAALSEAKLGETCGETASVIIRPSAVYNTLNNQIVDQSLDISLYYESTDSCHSSPELDVGFNYTKVK